MNGVGKKDTLITIDMSRKIHVKSGGLGVWCVGWRGVSEKFPRTFQEISRRFRFGPSVKNDIVTRQLKFFDTDFTR